jgi:hypothetical protein
VLLDLCWEGPAIATAHPGGLSSYEEYPRLRVVRVPDGHLPHCWQTIRHSEAAERQSFRGLRRQLTVESTYRTLYQGWLGNSPKHGSKHSVYPDAVLVNRDAQQITPGFLCDVTLRYQAPQQETSEPEPGAKLPEDEYNESVNDMEYPIEARPNFNDFAAEENGAIFGVPVPPMLQGPFLGRTKNSEFSGYLTFKVGSVTESVTKYYWGRPASVYNEVGVRNGNWLTTSGSVSHRGIYWTRTINRIYSKAGCNVTIYP